MIASQIISETIPTLKGSDPIDLALDFIGEFAVLQLPVLYKGKYIGMITEEAILDVDGSQKKIEDLAGSFIYPFVLPNQHIFEVIKIVADQNLTLIPVVAEEHEYVGSITLKCLISKLAEFNSIKDPGGIIVLELPLQQYSLSNIARIVELEKAIILGSFINTINSENLLELTLKLNVSDIKHIVATFERFEYTIKNTFLAADYMDILKDRYDSLMKYLSI